MDGDRDLTAAERRGRMFALAHGFRAGDRCIFDSQPDADGAAALAAARWAGRLGAEATVRLPRPAGPWPAEAPTAWKILAESGCRLNVVSATPAGPVSACHLEREGMTRTLRDFPDADAIWSRPLFAAMPLAVPVDHRSLRLSCAACRSVDRRAMDDYGVPGICLMENAALAGVAVALSLLTDPARARILIAAGGGNNGGDGLAMARGFAALGIATDIALCAPVDRLTGDAERNYRLLPDIPVHHLAERPETLAALASGASLIVDALLGTGFTGAVRGPIRTAIASLATVKVPILALDLPSGLDGDSGAAAGAAIRATACVTFAAVKPGLERGSGPELSGSLFLGDIGAPAAAFAEG
ncbi:MAG: NAD(P)H-hydrate epimerase [Planctomycetes bacterium]|nr:NAD(P)H-hydrate epimerase [Planctomycetota bacterium]